MGRFVWEVFLLAAAAALSWWFFLRPPESEPLAQPLPVTAAALPTVIPATQTAAKKDATAPPPKPEAAAAPDPEPAPVPQPDPQPAQKAPPAPPPAERGTPEGEEEGKAVTESQDSPDPQAKEKTEEKPAPKLDARGRIQAVMNDAKRLEEAEKELAGKARKGFSTVLIASAEEQLAIARFFGERVVLVPRSALDPKGTNPFFFELDPETGRVLRNPGRPALENLRQYRDLFDYEYGSLPEPLKTLRRSVLIRSDIFLFAALISAPEWALVMQRRAAALATAPDPKKPVRSFELRYTPLAGGGFDVAVDRIVFEDGSVFHPVPENGRRP